MQKSFAGIVLLAVLYLSTHTACKPTFSTTGPWRDTTIVYGLLDYTDTAHYIRIYKGYLDPNINAYTQAKIPDSIYYPANAITVVLNQIDTTTGNTIISLPLTRVDGNKEGLTQDTGVFANAPNILYKTKSHLVDGATYKLVITHNKNGKVVYATTSLVGSLTTVVPGAGQNSLNFFPSKTTTFIWNPSNNAVIYDMNLTIHYREIYLSDTQSKSVNWTIFTNYTPQSAQPALGVQGVGFYNILGNVLTTAPAGMTRRFTGIDFQLEGGGKELYTYYLSSIANSGITQGQVVKGYSNVHNGVGLLSSRVNRVIKNLQVNKNVLDTLACYYPNLHFLNSAGKLCGQ